MSILYILDDLNLCIFDNLHLATVKQGGALYSKLSYSSSNAYHSLG